MSKKIRTEAVDHLFEAILCLKDKEECYTFFEDVCTINELLSLSQRFEVAKMLTDKRTYLDISEKTGASTATISRVNRSLNYGNDGYEVKGFFRKSPRPSLPLKRAPPLTPTLPSSGEREEAALLGARNRCALRMAGHHSPRQIVRDGTAFL